MNEHTHSDRLASLTASFGLNSDQEMELKAVGNILFDLGRRSTVQVFDLGQQLARSKALVPVKSFGKWVKQACGFSGKTAGNYIAVHENLGVHRVTIEEASLSPTVMYLLARASSEAIKTLLSSLDNGQQLTVRDIKAMIGASDKAKPSMDVTLDIGGLAGLKKAAALKTTTDIVQFEQHVTDILTKIDDALEPLARKRAVRKGGLYDAVVFDCRHAHDLLNSIAAPMRSVGPDHMNWIAAPLPESSAWGMVQSLLHKMGGKEGWPESGELVDWLVKEVVPTLRFALHGEAISGEPTAAVEVREAITPAIVSLPEPKRTGKREQPMAELNMIASKMLAPRAAKVQGGAAA